MERVRPGDGGYEANRPLRGGEWCGPGGHTRTETGATLDTAPPGPQIRLPVLQGVERDPLLNSHNQHTALVLRGPTNGYTDGSQIPVARTRSATRIVSIAEETLGPFRFRAYTNQQLWELEFTSTRRREQASC